MARRLTCLTSFRRARRTFPPLFDDAISLDEEIRVLRAQLASKLQLQYAQLKGMLVRFTQLPPSRKPPRETSKSINSTGSCRRRAIATRTLPLDDLEEQPDGIFFFGKRMNHGSAGRAYSSPSPDQAGFPEQRLRDRQSIKPRHIFRGIGSFDVELVGLGEHAEKIVERKENVQRQF